MFNKKIEIIIFCKTLYYREYSAHNILLLKKKNRDNIFSVHYFSTYLTDWCLTILYFFFVNSTIIIDVVAYVLRSIPSWTRC